MPTIVMLWLYSIPLPLMVLVIFAGVFAAAALIYFWVARLLAPRYLAVLKAISPVTLTPIAVVFGLLTGFLASNVWVHSETAQGLVVRESGELARILRMSGKLPSPIASHLAAAVRGRIELAVNEEWPAMGAKRATIASSTAHLNDALTTAFAFEPQTEGQRMAQREIVSAIGSALDARRERILLSQQSISPVKWIVILLLAFLLLLTTAFIHADNRPTQAVTMAIFAASVAGCLILLVSHDHPFIGDLAISPKPLLDVADFVSSPGRN